MPVPLFVQQELSQVLGKREQKAMNAVEDLSEDELQEDDVAENVSNKFKLTKIDLKEQDREKGDETENGRELVVNIPYDGSKDVLRSKPSSWSSRNPRVDSLKADKIVVKVDVGSSDTEEVEKEVEDKVSLIKKWVGFANEDIGQFNRELESKVNDKVGKRISKLEEADDTMDELL